MEKIKNVFGEGIIYKEEDLKIKSGENPDYYDSFTVNGYISVNNISFDEDTDEE